MKQLSGFVVTWLVTVLIQGCAAQPQQVRTSPEPLARQSVPIPKDFDPTLIRKLQQFVELRRFLFTQPVDCRPDSAGVCAPIQIPIIQLSDTNGTKYCVGLIPEEVRFHGTASGNSPKRIVWQLVPPPSPTPANGTFEFLGDGDQGILVFQNIGNGSNRQIKDGKIGSGPGNADRDKFHIHNSHRLKGTAAFLPIIVQRVPPSSGSIDPEKVALCGTPDPLMVND